MYTYSVFNVPIHHFTAKKNEHFWFKRNLFTQRRGSLKLFFTDETCSREPLGSVEQSSLFFVFFAAKSGDVYFFPPTFVRES